MNNNYLWFVAKLEREWKLARRKFSSSYCIIQTKIHEYLVVCYVIYDCTSTTILISLLKTIIIGFNTCIFPHYFILSGLTDQAGAGMHPSRPSEDSSRILDTKKWILGSRLPNNFSILPRFDSEWLLKDEKIPCEMK